MRATAIATALAALSVVALPTLAQETQTGSDKAIKLQAKRERIDTMANTTIDELVAASPAAKELYGKAYGCAVFQVIKVAVGITGGGGEGLAVAKEQMDKPTYMEMATGGIGVGLGGQKYRVVFLFENKAAYDEFVYDGWDADAEANAAAGNQGANKVASFSKGVAIFQTTEKGLMANADLSGTKYWTDDELNRSAEADRTD